jgi:hypothetical protein
MTAAKVVLVANLLVVLAAVLAVLLLLIPAVAVGAYAGLAVTGDGRMVILLVLLLAASLLFGAAVIWLTVQCLRAFDARLAVAIAVLSMPVYVAATSRLWATSTERALARRFVNRDAEASADARAKLEATGRRTNHDAVPVLLEHLRTARDPGRIRATIELLGTIALYDKSVVAALAPLARRPDAPGADTSLRATAFAALRNVNLYVVDVAGVRYEGLTDDGLATFHLPKPNPLYGESVSVAVDGLVLPRPGSSDPCEIAMAQKARNLMADSLARGGRVYLRDVRIGDDGEYIAAVSRDSENPHDQYLHNLLMKDFPGIELQSGATHTAAETIDWCMWTATPTAR